ncbi:hypothetical protein SDC9_83310 [bioreactor metagenome]|uniref:Uncharacterized protein n=1 Tax=bioreactor metagenome TaxID=1076179 RepID=A0A644Z8V1_9ZZZZ
MEVSWGSSWRSDALQVNTLTAIRSGLHEITRLMYGARRTWADDAGCNQVPRGRLIFL